MSTKVYTKRGNTSMKEKKMVEQLQEKIAEMVNQDPNFTFEPANTPIELQRLYETYCVEDAELVDTANETVSRKSASDEFKQEVDVEERDPNQRMIDPFNREEPIVRDYVLSSEFPDENPETPKEGGGTYDEPRSFAESFEIPVAGEEPEPPSNTGGRFNKVPRQEEASEPMNPSFDTMDSAKQRKKTKRFAKSIVNLTCDLLEKGFEWYVLKDISEAKLTEYELNGEMDLTILLDVSENQQMTVKEFFLSQHQVVKSESQIDAEDREDLIEALTEVFLEKGIAPTPMQDLLLVGARVVGLQVIKAVGITNSNNSVLSQLRSMKKEEVPYQEFREPTPPPRQPEPFYQQEPTPQQPQQPQQRQISDYDIMFPQEEVKE